jgi:hypothetical protein
MKINPLPIGQRGDISQLLKMQISERFHCQITPCYTIPVGQQVLSTVIEAGCHQRQFSKIVRSHRQGPLLSISLRRSIRRAPTPIARPTVQHFTLSCPHVHLSAESVFVLKVPPTNFYFFNSFFNNAVTRLIQFLAFSNNAIYRL